MLVRSVFFTGLLLATASAQIPGDPQRALYGDVTQYNTQLNAGHMDSAQVIANANRLMNGYRGMAPYAGRYGPAEIEQNRLLARQTFDYLARVSAMYASDPAVMQALAGTYGYLGSFYATPGINFYPYAAPVAYGWANRLTRSMLLRDRGNSQLEANLQRLGMSWAAAAYVNGRFYGSGYGLPDMAGPPPPEAPVVLVPVPLPAVNAEKFTPEQAGHWKELHEQFLITSKKVHEARVLLEQLGARLRSQNMSLNQVDVAAALMMQGFLEDSVTLIQASQFEPAKEALTRAEYQRTKLKSVTGR